MHFLLKIVHLGLKCIIRKLEKNNSLLNFSWNSHQRYLDNYYVIFLIVKHQPVLKKFNVLMKKYHLIREKISIILVFKLNKIIEY